MTKNLFKQATREIDEVYTELVRLESILENRFEAIAAIGDEFVELDNIDEIKEKYFEVRRIYDELLSKK